MKNTQTAVALSLLVALSSSLFAKPVSLEDAQNVALNWMTARTGKHFTVKKMPLASSATGDNNATAHAYRIIELEPKGWVIVSADDIANPIIGYGQSPIHTHNLPPEFAHWMAGIDKQIQTAVLAASDPESAKFGTASPLQSQWVRLKKKPVNTALSSSTGLSAFPYTVKPLLWLGGSEATGIQWSQGEYYNAKCPAEPKSMEAGRALTGCVATAMGQVMRYYKKPVVGTGSFGYSTSDPTKYQHDYGYLFADFGSTNYDWNNMPTKLTAASTEVQIAAVSTLLYHAGVSVGMDYGYGLGADGSQDGGSLSSYHDPQGGPAADTALKNYFGFTVKAEHGSDYSYAAWKTKIKTSLNNGNPVLYGGLNNTGTSGHAFVLDGYAVGNGDDYFHFNWGWGGEANGQFTLLNLTPNGNDFSYNQQAIFFSGTNGSNNGGGGTGGGCTYNPENKGFDLMLILMLLMAGAYPLSRKYLRQA